jgi:serine protease Do
MANFRNSIPLIFGFIAMGLIIGVVLTTGFNLDSKSLADQNDSQAVYTESASEMNQTQESSYTGDINPAKGFAPVAKKVRPAIVTIYTTTNVKVPRNPWQRFFRGFGEGEELEEGEQEILPQPGLGSGIIVSEDGYILTNHHVIKDVDQLRVQLVDLQEFEAEVIGTDPETEVALIKIDAKGLTRAILGNSDKVEIGEWVLAIGSPLELNFSVTAGIVSALSRDINIIGRGGYAIENFIQTDAAINPGNSGGALVNSLGEVIGINTAIKTGTGTYIGYGFAVPINMAKTVMDDFINFGEVRRGYIGVRIESMTPTRAEGVGLDKPQGVLVVSVLPGKAADNAGIKAGDVILEVDGVKVNKTNQLQAKVGTFNPGDKVKLLLWQNREKVEYEIVLEGRDDQVTATRERPPEKERKVQTLGMNVKNLSQEELDLYDLDYGVVVQAIDRNSPASREGLRRGDVIYEVDGEKVESVSDLSEYIQNQESGSIIKIQTRSRFNDGTTSDRLVFLRIPK